MQLCRTSLMRAYCYVCVQEEHAQTLITSAKLICVPLLLRVISNESLTDSMLLHDHKYVWLHIHLISF